MMNFLGEAEMNERDIESKLRAIYRDLRYEFNFSFSGCLGIVISKRLRNCNGNCEIFSSRFTGAGIAKLKIFIFRDEFGIIVEVMFGGDIEFHMEDFGLSNLFWE